MTAPLSRSPTRKPVPARPALDGAPVGFLFILVLAVLIAYANSFPGAFFFDDDDAVLLNTSIRHLGDWRQVLWPPVQAGIGGRPFANLTFALNYAFGGYAPGGYHAVNLAIHLAGTLLLFGVARRTLRRPVLAGLVGSSATVLAAALALLWGLHPVQANIVDYVSQRTEGLMAALYLLTLYGFIRSYEERSNAWLFVATTACLLGMATKEDMVTAPALVFLYDRTFLAGSFLAAARENWRKHLALAATWILLAGLMLNSKLSERGVGFHLGHSWYEYGLTETRSIVRYLQLSFWPHPLIFDYGALYLHSFREAWPSVLLLSAALLGTVVALWRAPLIGFLAAWFFVTLSPSSSVIPVAQQPCAENRLYLPLVAAMALLAGVAFRALRGRALPLLYVVAAVLGLATLHRNPAFASEKAIWADTVAKNPKNWRAQNNLGNALLKEDRNDDAMPHFVQAIMLNENYADAHNNLGVTFLRSGHLTEAEREFRTAAGQKDRYADAHYNLGEVYLQQGRPADAIPELELTLQWQPNNPKAYNNLGIAYLDSGRVQDSIRAEQRALELQPKMPEAHYNLGNSLARAGRADEALAEYATTLTLDPKFAKALNNAGVIYLQRHQFAEAADRFRAALQINPNYPEAQRNLTLVTPH